MTNEEIVTKIQAGEDRRENIERLYLQNKGLIAKIARRFQGVEDFDDLAQEGYFGLVTASELWSPDGGATFSTYAFQWIRASIQRYIENNGSIVRFPVHSKERILSYMRAIDSFYLSYGRDPSPRELQALLKVTPKVLDRIKSDINILKIRSTSEPLTEEGDLTLEDSIVDDQDTIGDLLDDIDRDRLVSLLWSLVDELPDRESDILKRRYLNNETLQDCGEDLGISSERVRQIEARAIQRMRKKKTLDKLRPYIEERTIAQAYQSTGIGSFRRTWESAPEKAVFLKMKLEERALQN